MPTMRSLHDVFVYELRDLYSAERQLIRALPRMAKKAGSPALSDALTNHLRETETHAARLEEIFKTLGIKPAGVKCRGMEGLIEEGAELLEMDGTPEALDAAMIGAAQRVEHYEIAAYGTAISHAHAQGNTEAARLLEETLREEKKADELLTAIAEKGVNESADDTPDQSLMTQAVSMAFPRPPVKERPPLKANGRRKAPARRKKAGKTRESRS